jgi:glycosyltransferase involved in cell wall biosynthesis
MSELPHITVVVPTYNRARLVPRAVTSALAAVGPGDEIIVIDDGSTDGTEEALAPFGNRIRYIRLANGGAGRARNVGIAEANCELVAFLDSDDEWMPDKLRLQRALMIARPDVLYAFSDFVVREEGREDAHRYLINWHHDPRDWQDILGPGRWFSSMASLPDGRSDFLVHIGDLFQAQMSALYVFTSSLIVRKKEAGSALRFAEDLGIYEDWECYGRLAGAGPGAFMAAETVWNHGHAGERLTGAHALDRIEARIKVLERVWGNDPVYRGRNGKEYAEVLREQRMLRTKELLTAGRAGEARAELRRVTDPPFACRLLAAVPGRVTRGLWRFRQALR